MNGSSSLNNGNKTIHRSITDVTHAESVVGGSPQRKSPLTIYSTVRRTQDYVYRSRTSSQPMVRAIPGRAAVISNQ